MIIPLNQFEQALGETILKRGLSYFKKGAVSEPEELSHGLYEFHVYGNSDYTVRIKIENGNIINYDCNCPYDGLACKHVAACIFYHQQEVLDIKPEAIKGTISNKSQVKKKSYHDIIAEKLDQLSLDEIKTFVLEIVESNSDVRTLFKLRFPDQSELTKASLAKQIRSAVRSSVGSQGYIYGSKATKVWKLIAELINLANGKLKSGEYLTVLNVGIAIMEEMTNALAVIDDSDGMAGNAIYTGLELITSLVNEELPDYVHAEIFKYSISAIERKTFEGWDWHFAMLNLASVLMRTNEEIELVRRICKTKTNSEYDKERYQEFELKIIRKTLGDKAAEEFLLKNISNTDFRKKAVEVEIEKKDFKRAIRLLEEGIKLDKKDKPGLVGDWYKMLVDIYQITGENENLIKCAKELLINHNVNHRTYYDLLKDTVNEKDWNSFLSQLIVEISKNPYQSYSLLPFIFLEEKLYDQLFKFVAKRAHINEIERFETELFQYNKVELMKLYEECLQNEMKYASTRNEYKELCRYLIRIIRLSADETAERLIEDWKVKYKHRPALIEELSKVKLQLEKVKNLNIK